jgi:hypothetical protein
MKTLAASIFLERPVESLDWVIYILVATMFVIIISRILFSNNFESLRKIEKFQEVNDNQGPFAFVCQILFAVLVSSLAMNYLTKEYDFIFHTPILKVLAVALIILLVYGLRNLMGMIAAYAMGISFDQNFNLKTSNYYRAYSVGVLWISVLLFYFSGIPQKMVILVVTGIILVFIRVLQYAYKFQNQTEKQSKIWYYNILYLCALEILPLLVMFKFLTMW